MKRIALFFSLALAACGAPPPPEAPVQAVDTLSIDALRALPVGVSTEAVGLQGGCYVYNSPEGTVPLINDQGQQICA